MTQEIGSRVEAELAVERLLDKFTAWLLQQPEVILVWSQDRTTRKRVAEALADGFTKIPVREGQEYNRDVKRRVVREMNRQEREWWRGIRL